MGELDIVLTSDPVPGHSLLISICLILKYLVVAKRSSFMKEACHPKQLAFTDESAIAPLTRLDVIATFAANHPGIEAGRAKPVI